jgi:hypothetical protein
MTIDQNLPTMDQFLQVIEEEVFRKYFNEEIYSQVDKQDDPFDLFVEEKLSRLSSARGGKNTSPDIILTQGNWTDVVERGTVRDIPVIVPVVGVENKVVRKELGKNARVSSLDYNSTPPTPWMKVSRGGKEVFVEAFYLFGILSEKNTDGERRLEGVTIVPGKLLNASAGLYMLVTGSRTKEIGLGTHKDIANRNRPMFVGPNPLSCEKLQSIFSFFHTRSDLSDDFPHWKKIGTMVRNSDKYYCYSSTSQEDIGELKIKLQKSKTSTSKRGFVEVPLVDE